MNDITRILSVIEQGDAFAAEQLLPLVYDALRKMAAQKLAREKPGQTLQATALVHEAYVRLVDGERVQSWKGRGHFYAAAAEAMRRILIERARSKKTQRRGGGAERVELLDIDLAVDADDAQLLELDEALKKLAGVRPQAAELVQLRFFAGLSVEEAASALDISERTARRLWTYARAWLQREMDTPDE